LSLSYPLLPSRLTPPQQFFITLAPTSHLDGGSSPLIRVMIVLSTLHPCPPPRQAHHLWSRLRWHAHHQAARPCLHRCQRPVGPFSAHPTCPVALNSRFPPCHAAPRKTSAFFALSPWNEPFLIWCIQHIPPPPEYARITSCSSLCLCLCLSLRLAPCRGSSRHTHPHTHRTWPSPWHPLCSVPPEAPSHADIPRLFTLLAP
jgi:hypothetical protein